LFQCNFCLLFSPSYIYSRDRTSEKISRHDPREDVAKQPKRKTIKFISLYGIVELEGSSYAVLITKANFEASILFKNLFRVEEVQFVKIKNNSSNEDKTYVNMLQRIFDTKTFYFSFEYDLTRNLQKNT